ncbi:MAG: polymerase sigma factor FliA [Gammaproteobacteria bacterium]|jgi:RNA polymerase sigma factor for flagellar operon FliA|nr:DNA-directed polymerase [Gammaproteobacteria bacterium]MEA3140070.1 polymerase sigma factor FliA [Gammaproteobacteria bacterium]
MRASTQYTNTQKRGAKPVAAGHVPVNEVPQQELVLKHADLVKRIAYHLVSRMPPNVEVDDLIQSGMIGLLDAAKHYSATKGANFETYAGIRIRGAMLDEVRKSDWTPRSVHRNMREMADVVRKLENAKGHDASPTDIAEGLGVSIEDYHKLVQDAASCRLFSFDQLGSSEDESSPADHTRDEGPGPLDDMEDAGFRGALANGISGLPEREKLVLSLYYDEEMNLREIGEVLEVSESRVCQIHGQALVRLRARLSEWLKPN